MITAPHPVFIQVLILNSKITNKILSVELKKRYCKLLTKFFVFSSDKICLSVENVTKPHVHQLPVFGVHPIYAFHLTGFIF